MNAGHIFVTMGNILNFKSDAWLLPVDRKASPGTGWTTALPRLRKSLNANNLEPLRNETAFAVALGDWPDNEPMPVLTAVPFHGVEAAEDLRPRFRAFLDVATDGLVDRPRRDRNASGRSLLAVPFFGTGHGGGNIYRGEILRVLFEEAYAEAARSGVDVVFVFQDQAGFALAQQQRRGRPAAWSSLRDSHLAEARKLAELAQAGILVPFLGAGVSISAGAPTWERLLEHLAEEAGLSELEKTALKGLGNLDRASVLRTFYADRSQAAGKLTLGEAVKSAVDMKKYGLAPSLLACLPSEGAITLNYDSLFETAAEDAGNPRNVIPGKGRDTVAKWVLKLHGSVEEPESIVLTRDDYLDYSATKEALSALVKAHLITHHLLFVGFGLSDDHFHEIMHDVRRALPAKEAGGNFGTALMLDSDSMRQHLWGKHLSLVSMADPDSSEPDVEQAARTLEIFLDALIAYSSDSHSFLLADAYDGGLSPDERKLREALLTLKSLPAANGASSAAPVIDRMLRELGWDGKAPKSEPLP
ncbi:SIR2 family protein [Arthrobacter sp. PAMC25284]|uniref:SIR2 family protein n=1 Tax=Arthrobacter sp. PAMC25284 TaxID=2861279 RepID=UPI001C627609|nr:SIR2 family protein [Arthrobacter sp. PAMC25284]QYF91099.1 SIR2 family protein [Arthrobacter sp. PAMC25284]